MSLKHGNFAACRYVQSRYSGFLYRQLRFTLEHRDFIDRPGFSTLSVAFALQLFYLLFLWLWLGLWVAWYNTTKVVT
jgi:hypothetical protein